MIFLDEGNGEAGAGAIVLGSIVLLILLVGIFVFYPLVPMFTGAFQDCDGAFTTEGLRRKIVDPKIWLLDFLTGGCCGVAWRTLFLDSATTTGLGLAFALVDTRTGFAFKTTLRLLTVLPIITLPLWSNASAHRWRKPARRCGIGRGTLRKVSLPLMPPGLANSFLIGFIEPMADFGNPLVFGRSDGILLTGIYFAVIGAQNDPLPVTGPKCLGLRGRLLSDCRGRGGRFCHFLPGRRCNCLRGFWVQGRVCSTRCVN